MKEINSPEELYTFMTNNFKYGYKSNLSDDLYIRRELDNDDLYEKNLFNNYYLQTPEELLVSKCGICYDQVEFERAWFNSHGYDVWTYYMDFHNHVFLVYKENDLYKIIECTIKKFNGFITGNSLEDVIKKYMILQKDGDDFLTINLYNYSEVIYGCDFNTFINHAKEGEKFSV